MKIVLQCLLLFFNNFIITSSIYMYTIALKTLKRYVYNVQSKEISIFKILIFQFVKFISCRVFLFLIKQYV